MLTINSDEGLNILGLDEQANNLEELMSNNDKNYYPAENFLWVDHEFCPQTSSGFPDFEFQNLSNNIDYFKDLYIPDAALQDGTLQGNENLMEYCIGDITDGSSEATDFENQNPINSNVINCTFQTNGSQQVSGNGENIISRFNVVPEVVSDEMENISLDYDYFNQPVNDIDSTNQLQPHVVASFDINGVPEVVSDENENFGSITRKYYCNLKEKEISYTKLERFDNETWNSIKQMQPGDIKVIDIRDGASSVKVNSGGDIFDETAKDMDNEEILKRLSQVMDISFNFTGSSSCGDKLMSPRPPQEFLSESYNVTSAHSDVNITSKPCLPVDCDEISSNLRLNQNTNVQRNGPLVVQKPFNVVAKLNLDVNQLTNQFRPLQVEDNKCNRKLHLLQFQEYLFKQMVENGIVTSTAGSFINEEFLAGNSFSNFDAVISQLDPIFSKNSQSFHDFSQLQHSFANSTRKRPSTTYDYKLDVNTKEDVVHNMTCVSPCDSVEAKIEYFSEDVQELVQHGNDTIIKPKRQRTSKPQPSDREPEKMISLLQDRAPNVFSHPHKIVHHYLINLLCHKASFDLDLVRWEDFNKLQFYVSGPKVVARVWAMLKKNNSDDWENFARGIRNSRTRGFFLDSGTTRKKVFRLSKKAVDDFLELSSMEPNFYTNCVEIDSINSLSSFKTNICCNEVEKVEKMETDETKCVFNSKKYEN